jgi:hypothetical protein
MIGSVDQYLLDRLSLIKIDGESVTVYGFGPERPKGKTVPPCIALSKPLPFSMDLDRARPHLEVWDPSEETATINVPEVNVYAEFISQHGAEITGPESWDWSPFPTPIKLHYQVDLLAAEQESMAGLTLMLLAAIPPWHRPVIDDVQVIFEAEEPVNLDELEKPLFRTAVRYTVHNVWVDRLETTMVKSITSVVGAGDIEMM